MHSNCPSSQVERVLSRLKKVRKSGDGWSACCPAHSDNSPSLSIGTGDDGRVLLRCHAQECPPEKIAAALGLRLSDLFQPTLGFTPYKPAAKAFIGNAHKAAAETVPARPKGKAHPTAAAALAVYEETRGPPSASWEYHDALGEVVGLAVRWDLDNGKKYCRPVSQHAGGWYCSPMPEPRPLYRLPYLTAAEAVIVCEGEKAADAAHSLGFVATTSSMGSGAAGMTDWGPLAGKQVTILPDNDGPGRKYADAVAGILANLRPAPVVKIVSLPGVPEAGGDVYDWIEGHGDAAEPDDMRAELEDLAAAVTPVAGPPAVPTAAAPPRRVEGGPPVFVPDVVCLADVEPVAVPWLWYGRIPLGRITLLVGRPGGGKSFLTCDLAARISTGAAWPCGDLVAAPLGDTLFICAEDDPADTIAPRLIAAGADRRRVHLLRAAKLVEADGKETTVASDLGNVELIRDTLATLPGCRLVVIDPIGSYIGGRVDAHRDNEVRAVLAPLAELARERGVAVLLVMHTRKATASFADDTALGSRAFVGLARQVLHLSADPDDRDRKLFLPGKSNLCASPPGLAFRIGGEPVRLTWETEPLEGFHADDAMTAEGSGTARGAQPAARDAAAEWLAELLAAGPVAVKDVRDAVKAAGLSWSTVRRAQEPLGVKSRKRAFCDGWEWSMPGPGEGAHGGDAGRRCSTEMEPEHLRQKAAESPSFPEGAHPEDNLSTFAPGGDTATDDEVGDGRFWPKGPELSAIYR